MGPKADVVEKNAKEFTAEQKAALKAGMKAISAPMKAVKTLAMKAAPMKAVKTLAMKVAAMKAVKTLAMKAMKAAPQLGKFAHGNKLSIEQKKFDAMVEKKGKAGKDSDEEVTDGVTPSEIDFLKQGGKFGGKAIKQAPKRRSKSIYDDDHHGITPPPGTKGTGKGKKGKTPKTVIKKEKGDEEKETKTKAMKVQPKAKVKPVDSNEGAAPMKAVKTLAMKVAAMKAVKTLAMKAQPKKEKDDEEKETNTKAMKVQPKAKVKPVDKMLEFAKGLEDANPQDAGEEGDTHLTLSMFC